MVLVSTANHALFFLIAWELMSLSSYLLIIFEHKKEENAHAGLFYFIMMHIGSAFIITALLLLARYAGSGDFDVIRGQHMLLPSAIANIVFLLALFGFGIKAGIIPLHTWLPEAHPAAPAHISALMSGVMIKTALLLLLRFLFEFLPSPEWWWGGVLVLLGVISAVLGVLNASAQTNIKRLLAFSSIENIGIMFIAFGTAVIFLSYHANVLVLVAISALLFHIMNHAIFKSLLFFSSGEIVSVAGSANMENMGGLGRLLPKTMIAFFVAALAISAFPPLNGFASEWLIIQTLIIGLAIPSLTFKLLFILSLAGLALASGITILAFAKAFGSIFLARPRFDQTHIHAHRQNFSIQFSYIFLAFLTISIGLSSGYVTKILTSISASIGSEEVVDVAQLITIPSANLFAVGVVMLTLLIVVIVCINIVSRKTTSTFGATWDCGYPLSPNNEISATAISRTLLMIFKPIIPTKKLSVIEYSDKNSKYFITSKHTELDIVNYFDRYAYQPISTAVLTVGSYVKKIQNGNLNAYIFYVLLTLIVLVTIYL
jgi:hydrogenase-4 component B